MRWLTGDSDIREGPGEFCEACLVKLNVNSVPGVETLNVRFISISSRVERGAAEGFRQISGKSLIVIRMKPVFKRMSRFWVRKTALMPASAKGGDGVKPAERLIEASFSHFQSGRSVPVTRTIL